MKKLLKKTFIKSDKNRSKKKVKKNLIFLSFILIIIIIGIIELRSITQEYKKKTLYNNTVDSYQTECEEMLNCPDCKVVVSCMKTIESSPDYAEYIYLKVKNQNTIDGDCFLIITFNISEIKNKTYDLGLIPASTTKGYKIMMDFPNGSSTFIAQPYCDWIT